MHAIDIGTCGWSYPEWAGPLYPRATKSADFLSSYARRFAVVEVDSTFYHSPAPKTVEGWRTKTPDMFGFSLKVPQAITHEKLLRDCDDDVNRFVDAVRILGTKLRCCVLQFPYFKRSLFSSAEAFVARLEPFLAGWPRDVPVAVEVRNASWLAPPLGECLQSHGAALVLADIVRMPAPLDVLEQFNALTSSFGYIRLIGHRAEVESLTKKFDRIVVDRSDRIPALAEAIRQLAGRMPVLVFVNNHFAGYAPETIRQLREALGLQEAAADEGWFFGKGE